MPAPRSRLGLGSLMVAVVIILALGVGTVYAAIPNSNGKYYACYVKDTGVVKLINYPKVSTCPAGEKLISWNAKGPVGPAGAQGPTGPAGAQGPTGPAGAAGITKITLTPVINTVQIPAGTSISGTVTCPAGKVVGGGFGQQSSDVLIADSHPSGSNGWIVYGSNPNPALARNLDIYAICMTTDPSAVIAKASNFKVSKKHK